jgi:predicted ATPase
MALGFGVIRPQVPGMYISGLTIKGFRSIRELTLSDLPRAVIFYGPNGSGKSNVLEAIRLAVELLQSSQRDSAFEIESLEKGIKTEIFKLEDFHSGLFHRVCEVSIKLEGVFTGPLKDLKRLEVTVGIQQLFPGLIVYGVKPIVFESANYTGTTSGFYSLDKDQAQQLRAWVGQVLPRLLFRLVPAVRQLKEEQVTEDSIKDVLEALNEGNLKQALYFAYISPNPQIRQGIRQLRKLLQGPPLERLEFTPVFDPQTNRVDLQEELGEYSSPPAAISLDLAGLGIQQLYTILASILLSGAHCVGIEEPEAHLHPKTSGLHLRQLLKRLLEEGQIQQLFIATHSNLFDLDPGGYFEVSLENGATKVERKTSLALIDKNHLYEPGPARHVLQDVLTRIPDNGIVFKKADGTAVTKAEAIQKLLQYDPEILEYLDTIYETIVRFVQLKGQS